MPTIHIKPANDECGAILTIGAKTSLWRRESGRTVAAELADFTVGKMARAWTSDGTMLLSCPGQGSAIAVELLSDN
jgi:hypothetical protein